MLRFIPLESFARTGTVFLLSLWPSVKKSEGKVELSYDDLGPAVQSLLSPNARLKLPVWRRYLRPVQMRNET